MISSLDRKRLRYAFFATLMLVASFSLFQAFLSKSDSQTEQPKGPPLTPSAFEGDQPPAWVILLTVNHGFFDYFENWIAHYNRLNVTREDVGIVIVAYDDAVMKKIQYYKGLPPRTIVVSSESSVHTSDATDLTYGSLEFKKLMANRANIVLGQLHKGPNLILVDLDIVLLKDPFPYLIDPIDRGEYDMLIQIDLDYQHSGRKKKQMKLDTYCAGLFAAANNPKILEFMKDWQNELSEKPELNQPIFNTMLYDNPYELKYAGLDTELFMSGHFYWEDYKDQPEIQAKAVAVHGNFIKGHNEKKQRFKDSGMWLV